MNDTIYLIFEVDKRGERHFYGAYKHYLTALGNTQVLNKESENEDRLERYEMKETTLNG